ncbi:MULTISPECIES: RNA-directed DNA polymerase [unclassified Rhizobium]|uniref:RNA-directed DNA polymerase n=1 Tax=unclassified Rhizobium TaxID=2613769 RepID=UPI00177F2D9C|nr:MULTISPECIES: RNA-directed DNA polymerase [unclassified Rhizobium]MBD8690947.1 RNA-directed DNA polymerase [Rhizobium sp. CFBP 13717]
MNTLQSPKFKFVERTLSSVFSNSALQEEWKKRVKYQIRKQAIFDPIEYRDLNQNLDEMIDGIKNDIKSGTYQVKQSKRFLIEKSGGLCRQMTIVHPRDLLVLERLSRSFHHELKNKSPSKSAFFEPDDRNFVKGFQQSDFEYGSFASWKRFQTAVFGFADEKKYVVVTDVANFYDFINFQHLRNIISSLVDVREEILDILIYLLNRLTWTPDFMPLTQVGMPQIETTATRVLANALLYEVDRICEDSSSLNYARFMDDMDVGVDTVAEAKKIIRDIDLTLQSRQLRLNSSKTKILSREEAYHHFRIEENSTLSVLENSLTTSELQGGDKPEVMPLYEKWITVEDAGPKKKDSLLKDGNGPKIHKRILSLIHKSGEKVPDFVLLDLVENDPGMRSTALRYLAHSEITEVTLFHLLTLSANGTFVDDASIIELSSLLLHARITKTNKNSFRISRFISKISKSGDIQLYCAMFLSGKFQDHTSGLRLLEKNIVKIRGDFWLSRAAGGMAPIFLGTNLWSDFLGLVRLLRADDAESVVNFMRDLQNTKKLSQSQKAYFESPNRSFPQKIYYPKILQLLAVKKNPYLKAQYEKIASLYPCLSEDPYINALGF